MKVRGAAGRILQANIEGTAVMNQQSILQYMTSLTNDARKHFVNMVIGADKMITEYYGMEDGRMANEGNREKVGNGVEMELEESC